MILRILTCLALAPGLKPAFSEAGLTERLQNLYRQIVNSGISASTPEPLIDRIVFSNLMCFYGLIINFIIAWLNFQRSSHFMLAMNGLYLFAITLSLYLNSKHHYLASRVSLLTFLYTGLFVSGLVQGPAIEIEHFLLPLGILAFCVFYGEEKFYGFAFLILAGALYFFLAAQQGPLLQITEAPQIYTRQDLMANRFFYLLLFLVSLISLSNTFNRALKIIDDQRGKLFEERRLALIGRVASNVAHEINSPLTAIDLHLFQLENCLSKPAVAAQQAKDHAAKIRKISRRISVIVNNLKFFGGKDGQGQMTRSPIGAVIESALELNRDRIDANCIRLKLEIDDPATEVSCRPVALSQVFLNLINNAVDAVVDLPKEKRWISLKSSTAQNALQVAIEDGGSIVSPEVRNNLFKSFFTTKPPGRGTGLGLSLSKETVEEHHGSLRFDSQSANTRFVVELPLHPEGP